MELVNGGCELPNQFSQGQLAKLSDMVRGGDLSVVKGGLLNEFESFSAGLFGTVNALSLCNGSSAVYLALRSCNVGPGDEVIVPTSSFHGATVSIPLLGARPVFADIDKATLAISPSSVLENITNRTKAILVLQPWGNVADIDALSGISRQYDLKLISDSSHAHDARWKGKPLGHYYDAIAASFGKGKLISGGELGVLASNGADIHDSALLFGHTNRVTADLLGTAPQGLRNAVGLKLRPHALALQIAIWNGELFRSYGPIMQRNGDRLMHALEQIEGVEPLSTHPFATRSYWKPVIRISNHRVQASELVTKLRELGVDAEKNNYQTLLHENLIFTKYYGITSDPSRFPNATAMRDALFHVSESHLLEPNGWEQVALKIRTAMKELQK